MDKLQLLAFVLVFTWTIWGLLQAGVNQGKLVNHRLWPSMTATLLNAFLLYLGGFFVVLELCQIIWFVLTAVGLMAVSAGYMKDDKHSFGGSLFGYSIMWILYIKGGFWYTGFTPFN